MLLVQPVLHLRLQIMPVSLHYIHFQCTPGSPDPSSRFCPWCAWAGLAWAGRQNLRPPAVVCQVRLRGMEAAERGCMDMEKCFREYERVRFAVSGLPSEYASSLFLVFLSDYLLKSSRNRSRLLHKPRTQLGILSRQLTHNLT